MLRNKKSVIYAAMQISIDFPLLALHILQYTESEIDN